MASKTTISIDLHPYFSKQGLLRPLIQQSPDPDCALMIVIPIFREEELLNCLDSLLACHRPKQGIEVILLFNAAESDESSRIINQQTKREVVVWIAHNRPYFKIHSVEKNRLSDQHAGVGLARKIGMDEAARRLYSLKRDSGLILCLDADCTVAINYLQTVEAHFDRSMAKAAASIYFEHPLEGGKYDTEIYDAILHYELHLRYYKYAMRFSLLPFDRYTVGSSMAVRANAYVAEGGMNKRKAGEDFYFLQKYLIKSELDEINTTAVYPSPRISDRVPFGTGRAVQDHLIERKDLHFSYASQSFKRIRDFMESIEVEYPQKPRLPKEFKVFFDQTNWEVEWEKMRTQSKDLPSFKKRFFQWFTPFKVLKLLHFLRDRHFPNEAIELAVKELLDLEESDVCLQLKALRKRDQF